MALLADSGGAVGDHRNPSVLIPPLASCARNGQVTYRGWNGTPKHPWQGAAGRGRHPHGRPAGSRLGHYSDSPFLAALPFTTLEVIGKSVSVGTKYRWTFALPLGLTFRFDEMVTEWVENERIAYRANSGWEMEAGPVLAPERGGTRFNFTLPYRFPGFWRLTPDWLIQLGCRQGLENLPEMIEA